MKAGKENNEGTKERSVRRSAGWQPAVSRIGNPQDVNCKVRLKIFQRTERPRLADCQSATQQTASLRYAVWCSASRRTLSTTILATPNNEGRSLLIEVVVETTPTARGTRAIPAQLHGFGLIPLFLDGSFNQRSNNRFHHERFGFGISAEDLARRSAMVDGTGMFIASKHNNSSAVANS